MQRKTLLLATTALAIFGAAQQAQADGLYLSVFGGANFSGDQSGRDTATNHTFTSLNLSGDADTGFVVGGAVGTELSRWVKGLRVEMEVSYRRNDNNGTFFLTGDSGSSDSGTFDANGSTFAVMANAWYEIDLGSKIRPYVGGGAGWARSHYEVNFNNFALTETDTDQIENSGFAWQLGIGALYEVAPGIDLGLGYRFFNGPRFSDIENDIIHNHAEVNLDNESHAVMLNLNIEMP